MSRPTFEINEAMRVHMERFRNAQRFPVTTTKQLLLMALDAAIQRLESGWKPAPHTIRDFLAADDSSAVGIASIVRDDALTARLNRLGELLVKLNNRFLSTKLLDVRRGVLPYSMRLTIAAALWIAVTP